MDIKKNNYFGLLCILFLTACDNAQPDAGYPVTKLNEQQWLPEIQKRFDAANPNGNQAVCIITKNKLQTDFSQAFSPSAGTSWFVQHDLLEEKIKVNERGVTYYYYRLTDKGAASRPTWPNSWRTGLCFGSVQVENVSRITPSNDKRTTEVEFMYHINNIPDWAQELMPQFFPNIKEGKIAGSAQFDMADKTHLRCQSGISNEYVEEDKFFNAK
ncbi:hypothetical protein B9037_023465 [Klebsiella aerogenes]|uniref:hypothetical protein n=1 Tax=Klebsiella aerogenes TaxID=548 RepID=UPI000B41D93A|nr:hypothetical protein [Klebsiella aerogenes]MEB7638730.1 hypothetical protein [Klebsiella aerogenes]RNT24363.1 hypothetical protein B9037_023465 [Klebsiella aerogenes]HDS4948176.1 hypothetical protein [Klebsiella aerogenes]